MLGCVHCEKQTNGTDFCKECASLIGCEDFYICGGCYKVGFDTLDDNVSSMKMIPEPHWWLDRSTNGPGGLCVDCFEHMLPDDPDVFYDGPIAKPDYKPQRLVNVEITTTPNNMASIAMRLDNGELKPFRDDVNPKFAPDFGRLIWRKLT